MALPNIATRKKLNLSKFKLTPQIALLILMSLCTFFSCSAFVSPGRSSGPATGVIYVQTADGDHLEAKAVPDDFRPPENVKKYTSRWLTGAFTWTQPAKEGAPNYIRDGSIRYPYPLYKYAMGIELSYGQRWLEEQASKYDKELQFNDYVDGRSKAVVQILRSAVNTKDKGWEVTLIANRVHTGAENQIIAVEKFNKKIILMPVEPVSKEQMTWGDGESQLAQNLNQMQSSGLLITQITEF